MQSKFWVLGVLGVFILVTAVFTSAAKEPRTIVTAEEAVMTVNGEPILYGDFTSRVELVEQNMLLRRAEIDRTLNIPRTIIRSQELMESTPVQDIAIASLIVDISVYQAAVAQGYQADPQQVAEEVARDRESFERTESDPARYGISPEFVAAFRSNIDAMGEERFWGEYYPQLLAQEIAVDQFQMAVAEASGDQSGAVWFQLQSQIFGAADVEIINPYAVAPGTLDGATIYLHTLWGIILEGV